MSVPPEGNPFPPPQPVENAVKPAGRVLRAAVTAWGTAQRTSQILVAGGSMWPTLHAADQVLIDHSKQSFKPGDVIVFWQGEMLVIHRLLRIMPDGTFQTAGDACICNDLPVAMEQVVGIGVEVYTANGLFRLDTPGARCLAAWLVRTFPLKRWFGVRQVLRAIIWLFTRFVLRHKTV